MKLSTFSDEAKTITKTIVIDPKPGAADKKEADMESDAEEEESGQSKWHFFIN